MLPAMKVTPAAHIRALAGFTYIIPMHDRADPGAPVGKLP